MEANKTQNDLEIEISKAMLWYNNLSFFEYQKYEKLIDAKKERRTQIVEFYKNSKI